MENTTDRLKMSWGGAKVQNHPEGITFDRRQSQYIYIKKYRRCNRKDACYSIVIWMWNSIKSNQFMEFNRNFLPIFQVFEQNRG